MLSAATMTYSSISKQCSLRAVRRPECNRHPGKKKWGFKSIDGILRNEKYYGAVCICKTYMSDAVIPKRIINDGDRELVWWLDYHEPIISKKNGSRQLPFYLAPSQQPGIMKKQKNTKKNASCTQLWYWGKMRLHPAACEKPDGTRLFNA